MYRIIWRPKGQAQDTNEVFENAYDLHSRVAVLLDLNTKAYIQFTMQIIYPNNYVITINAMKMGLV